MLVLVTGIIAALAAIVALLLWRRKSAAPKPASGKAATSAKAVGAHAAPEEDVDSSMASVTIWYGSQTGTAENLAKTLAKEGKEKGFRARAVDLEHFTPDKLKEGGVCIFLMATYGEGDPTDNAVDFVRWLQAAPGGSLSPLLRFTVFGLGNRQYEHYNKMGKQVNEKLGALGAARVYRHGEGDDDGNLEEDFDAWRSDGLWDALTAASATADAASPATNGHGATPAKAAVPRRESSTRNSGAAPAFPWRLVTVPPPASAAADPGACAPLSPPTPEHLALAHRAELTSRHFFSAVPVRVVENRELRQAPGTGFSTRHLELALEGSGLTYRTADNLHVLPENEPSVVESVARWLKFKPDEWFVLEPATATGGASGGAAATATGGDEEEPAPPLFPTPCNVRTALTRYLDLGGVPRKELLAALAPYAKAAEERTRLVHLASREGKADWAAWAVTPERAVYELFSEFPSLVPPLEAFLQLMPRLQPRAYTIASSSLVAPARVALCVSVLDAPKPGPDGRRRLRGVCSNTFQRMQLPQAAGHATRASPPPPPHPLLRVFVRPSTFHLPADVRAPVLLVGPGTGVAPMVAFCAEREALRARGEPVGPTVLFFGCRNRTEDYVYRDDMARWVANGTLAALHVAFSRETASKVYVQNLIEQQGAEAWRLVAGGAHIYVCGATRMGHDVAAAFERVFSAHGGLTAEGAASKMKELHGAGRYVVELWS